MKINTKGAAKRLIVSLLSLAVLAGCVAVPYGDEGRGSYGSGYGVGYGDGWGRDRQHDGRRDDGRRDEGRQQEDHHDEGRGQGRRDGGRGDQGDRGR
jgi:hypothetical protein